ncbi:hypothetical protein Tco_1219519, partial [Tanacetum coccineum]
HDIDWSDPAVIRYHALQNRSFSVAEVKKNMCMYLKNQGGYKLSHFKGMSYEDIRPIFERKQKLEDDAEKKELRDSMDVVPREDVAIDVESLSTKYPIVDWKTHEDMKIIFEPNEEDEIWKNQQDYNLISWRIFDSYGIHMLLMHIGIAIHMMIEKKYPLTQEMLSRMLGRRLEVDQESEMAFELLSIDSFQGLTPKVPHHGIDLWLQLQIFYDHVNLATRRTIDQAAGGKLRDKNAEESWALIEDLALYDNESWNEPRDFTSTSDYCLIKIENQVQRLMEAHLVPKPPV